MSRATLILNSKAAREKAARWALQAPVGTRIEFKAPKRSVPQNDKMWALLSEIAQQVTYHGHKLTPDDFKLVFLDALKRSREEELRIVPNTDSTGFVNLSNSSSDLSKGEMADLITIIEEWGLRHGVVFSQPDEVAA